MAIANVALTDTFNTWVIRTNEAIDGVNDLQKLTDGTGTANVASLFVQTGGATGQFLKIANSATGEISYGDGAADFSDLTGTIANTQFASHVGLQRLTVANTLTTDISKLKLSGGSSGNVIATDGAGNLSFTNGSTRLVYDYVAGVDFVAGTTTTITLASTPPSSSAVDVTFDGVQQHHTTWYLASGNVLTFTSAIPATVGEVEVVITSGSTVSYGVPTPNSVDATALTSNSVTTTKILDGAVTATKILDGAVTTTKILDGAVTTTKILDGAVTTAKLDPSINITSLVIGSVVTAAGTSIDFSGIPSGVKRIVVSVADLSTNGASVPVLQLGTSGGIETTGYAGGVQLNAAYHAAGAGFPFISPSAHSAAGVYTGTITLTLLDQSTNIWVGTGIIAQTNITTALSISAANKTLSSVLTSLRITSTSGADTFDSGKINILYEV